MKKLNNTLMVDFSIEAEMLPTGPINWAMGQFFCVGHSVTCAWRVEEYMEKDSVQAAVAAARKTQKKSADMSAFYRFLFDVGISLPPMGAS